MITIRIDVEGIQSAQEAITVTPVTPVWTPVQAFDGVRLYNPSADAMTPGAIKLLPYISAGLSYKEIGKALNLAESTVKSQAYRLTSRIGAQSSTTLGVWALLTGTVTVDDVLEVWRTYYPHLVEV